jgi:hypothetical protein
VFPARLGRRAGEEKRPLNSYAKRLRRELFRAGVVRMRPIEVPATKKGMRTDLGKRADGSKFAPNPRDPLYFETSTTLPVDFHSFRRAFASALAEAHHPRRRDPEPRLGGFASALGEEECPLASRRFSSGIVTARDGSRGTREDGTSCGHVTARPATGFAAPAAGLEPATRRLTAACSTN